MDIYLMSSVYYRENSIAIDDLEEQFILPSIDSAQDIMLPRVMCQDLYDYFIGQVKLFEEDLRTNPTSVITTFLKPKEMELLEGYIRPFLLEYTSFYLLTYNMQRYANKGVVMFNAENSISSTISTLYRTKQFHKVQGEHKGTKLIKFIESNIIDFPLFNNCKKNCRNGRGYTDAEHIINMY